MNRIIRDNYLLLSDNSLIGNKIVNRLNRQYSVTEMGCPFENLNECRRIIALAVYKGMKGVILDSTMFLSSLETDKSECILQNIEFLIRYIIASDISFIFLYIVTPFEGVTDEYSRICQRIMTYLQKKRGYLVFRISSVYGEWNERVIPPLDSGGVLADSAAAFVISKIKSKGLYDVTEISDLNGDVVIKHQRDCIFKAIYQLKPEDFFKGKCVADIRIKAGESLAEVIPNEICGRIDYVCPVPNTGLYYAMGLANAIKKPYIQSIIKETSADRTFQLECVDDRKRKLWSHLYPIKELIEGKVLAVVDEAVFTGATLKVVCEMLAECGAKGIFLCIPTPKCRYHCDYLVHPQRPMLLEYIKDTMLEDYFNADGIWFQSDSSFEKMMNNWGKHLCAECFYGKPVNTIIL